MRRGTCAFKEVVKMVVSRMCYELAWIYVLILVLVYKYVIIIMLRINSIDDSKFRLSNDRLPHDERWGHS